MKLNSVLLCFRDQIYFENSVQYLYPFEWSNNEWLLYLLLRSISWTKTSAGLISCGHTGIPRLWTLDPGRWTLDAGSWTLESGRSTVDTGLLMLDSRRWDSRRWTLDGTLWTLGSGHWTLSLAALEQNQKPISDFVWLNYWKSLRTSRSRLLCRDYRFWRG